jgi:hypothetical protein
MKPSFFILAAGILTLSLLAASADPKSDVKDAIKKLGDRPNYSWTFTPKTEGSEAARRQGPIDGKTEKEGFTHIKGTSNDSTYEAAFKGGKIAVYFAGSWIGADELEEDSRVTRRLKAFKNPAQEADELLGKTKEVKKESDEAYSGDLTAEAAKELFGQLGRRAAESTDANGSIKFWTKDGVLSKYELSLKGKFTVGEDKREVDLSRTVTVEIKDVGSTKVTLPDEVKKKLS